MKRILIIHDDHYAAKTVGNCLHSMDYPEPVIALGGGMGILMLQEEVGEATLLVLLDLDMRTRDAPDVLDFLKREKPAIRVIVMSEGFATQGDLTGYARSHGVAAALPKPFLPQHIVDAVRHMGITPEMFR